MKHTRGRDGSRSAADWNRLTGFYRKPIAKLIAGESASMDSLLTALLPVCGKPGRCNDYNCQFNRNDLEQVLRLLGYTIDRGGIVRKKPKEPKR